MTTATDSTVTWPPSPEFWSTQFPSRTDGAVAPYLFKGLVPTDLLGPDDVFDGLRRLRRAATEGEPTSARARVYVGEDRRDEVIDTMLTAPWAEDDFVSWMRKLIGAQRFSLVINNLETTSPALAAVLGELIGSAHAGWGVPIGGSEQVAFVGNYAGTAFGVHEGYEDAFLVHLGPGTKRFYTWSGDLYRELTGGRAPTFGDYTALLEHGERHDLQAGDVLFLPRRVFHVGVQDDFSISVAVPLYTFSDTRMLALSLLPESLRAAAVIDVADETPSPMHPLVAGPGPVAAALVSAATDMLITVSDQLGPRIAELIEARWRTLHSNGGWEATEHDLVRADAARDAVTTLAAGGTHLRVIPPYTLYTDPHVDEHLHIGVAVRGLVLRVPNSPAWGAAMASLAAGHSVRITDELGGDALALLLETGGIQVLTEPEFGESR
ncbi:JmjC domain-containing protein [Nocardia sp. BMG111209]|uniref:JmjC domain-containing protein n=1 Tax=Nocardia sp. BMG111209 TaxID=1160137 RepID=UPI00037D244F|nr:cupin domain-containing protein [Nocardia sp. BMG111209]